MIYAYDWGGERASLACNLGSPGCGHEHITAAESLLL